MNRASFTEFFHIWAEVRGWDVPDFHYRACHWLEHRGEHAVMMIFRGAAKSTLLAIHNAWLYYINPQTRVLHQSADDGTAYKTSRDTQAVLRRHPLTRGILLPAAQIEQWWVDGADDARNASMYARGIMSNVTSSRADEIQNDDVEVPRNIGTVEAREKLRYRLGEQTHIAVPGARKLYVGTPHTHDSLYQEQIRMGADALIVRLFEDEQRVESASKADVPLDFTPEYVFEGIGEHAKLLVPGRDYVLTTGGLRLMNPTGAVLDCYAGCAWPERFDRRELLKRRRECRTLNTWDSQYQLHAKPMSEVRLDPEHLIPYEVEPELHRANNALAMYLGGAQIVSATCRIDPASGKPNSDKSSLSVVLQDSKGVYYWHRALELFGEIAEYSDDGKTIEGGQVLQVCDAVRELNLPRVDVETNGIGNTWPAILRSAFRQQKVTAAVRPVQSTGNKNRRILAAIEPPLRARHLWAHTSVIDAVATQMREWDPAETKQPDDHLDSGAGAIAAEPVRIGSRIKADDCKTFQADGGETWQPAAATFEAVWDDS